MRLKLRSQGPQLFWIQIRGGVWPWHLWPATALTLFLITLCLEIRRVQLIRIIIKRLQFLMLIVLSYQTRIHLPIWMKVQACIFETPADGARQMVVHIHHLLALMLVLLILALAQTSQCLTQLLRIIIIIAFLQPWEVPRGPYQLLMALGTLIYFSGSLRL